MENPYSYQLPVVVVLIALMIVIKKGVIGCVQFLRIVLIVLMASYLIQAVVEYQYVVVILVFQFVQLQDCKFDKMLCVFLSR